MSRYEHRRDLHIICAHKLLLVRGYRHGCTCVYSLIKIITYEYAAHANFPKLTGVKYASNRSCEVREHVYSI